MFGKPFSSASINCRCSSHIYRAVNRDPTYFPDFDEFRPERYLNESGELADPIPDTHVQGHLSYGSGRRYVLIYITLQ